MSHLTRPRNCRWLDTARTCLRQAHTARLPQEATKLNGPEVHGEQIWVFCHRRSDQVIYSLSEKLNAFHSLKQLPFNGKKTKPAKLRKDYWSPLAIIQFPQGRGDTGRSVYQKLRELKHLHQVAWTDDFRYKRPEEYSSMDKKTIADEKARGKEYRPVRSKGERGVALNAQRTNCIADMAAVLNGQGSGNKISARDGASDQASAPVRVSVRWASDQDKEYAESWSENVEHGLLMEPIPTSRQEEQ